MKRTRRQPAEIDRTSSSAPPDAAQQPTNNLRREIALLALIVLVGASLRVTAYSQSSVEHYDEGVYASRFWFLPPDYGYPLHRLHAPPLLPATIEWAMILRLPPKLAALGPNILAGCATIAAIWWLGRTWFRPTVGLAAAMLCAGSDFHIAYSASALTDILLTLWLILALQCLGLAWRSGKVLWALLAGLCTGLAWWTKYNGWLPVAMGIVSLVVITGIRGWFTWRQNADRSAFWGPTGRQAAMLLLMMLVAGIIWLPYWLSLQSTGGYAPIAANHSRYLLGLGAWPQGLARQIAAQQAMQGWLGPLSLGLAAGLAMLFPGTRLRPQTLPRLLGIVLLVLAGWASLFTTITLGSALGIALGIAALARRSPSSAAERETSLIPLVLLTVWWGSMALATPCYWPYPRLVLPWLAASWIGMALFLDHELAPEPVANPMRRIWEPWLSVALVAASVTAALLLPLNCESGPLPGRDRRSLESIAGQIHTMSPEINLRAVYVCGEPALLFQLFAAGEPVVSPLEFIPREPASDRGEPIETWLVVGPRMLADPKFQAAWKRAEPHWEILHEFEYTPSQLVWLDDHDPTNRDRKREQETGRIRVARMRRYQ
jgi:dolichyl-phosphate-mannose-protein mannosyltransferase